MHTPNTWEFHVDMEKHIKAIRAALDTLQVAGDYAEIAQRQSSCNPDALRTAFVSLLAELDDARDKVAAANTGLDTLVSQAFS